MNLICEQCGEEIQAQQPDTICEVLSRAGVTAFCPNWGCGEVYYHDDARADGAECGQCGEGLIACGLSAAALARKARD